VECEGRGICQRRRNAYLTALHPCSFSIDLHHVDNKLVEPSQTQTYQHEQRRLVLNFTGSSNAAHVQDLACIEPSASVEEMRQGIASPSETDHDDAVDLGTVESHPRHLRDPTSDRGHPLRAARGSRKSMQLA